MTNNNDKTNTNLRFEFGKNWKQFLQLIDDNRIEQAKKSLSEMLELKNFEGKSFLDIGCGSGLFRFLH